MSDVPLTTASAPPSSVSPTATGGTATSTTSTGAAGTLADQTTTAATVPTANAAAAPARQTPAHHDPKVNELHTMFPTVEIPVIEMILESCEGSQDRAIEQLLSMTDENFKPDELAAARREEASQLDLDAEFARSLQMQDQDDLRRSRTYSGAPPEAALGAGELPYQPRIRRARPPHQQGGYDQHPQGGPYGYTADGRDDSHLSPEQQRHMQDRYGYAPGQQRENEQAPGMMMVEEKLEKFAEVGKQTFNSLLSKAKAKYSEFQAQQAATRSQQETQGYGQGSQQAQRGGWSSNAPGGGRGGMQNWNQGQTGAHSQRGGLWEDSRSFDSRDESIGSESGYDHDAPSQPQPVLRQSAARWQPTDTYDDAPLQPARTASAPGNRIELNHGGGRRSPAATTGVGSPDRPSTGKIDPAKLGILPKKKVDLLSTSPSASNSALNRGGNSSSPPAAGGTGAFADPNPSLPSGETSRTLMSKIPATPPGSHSKFGTGDSDDELEYTRNPFDEK